MEMVEEWLELRRALFALQQGELYLSSASDTHTYTPTRAQTRTKYTHTHARARAGARACPQPRTYMPETQSPSTHGTE